MGLVGNVVRAAIAATFLFFAVLAYAAGVRNGAIQEGKADFVVPFSLLENNFRRLELIEAIKAGDFQESARIAKQIASVSPLDELPFEAALAMASTNGVDSLADEFARLTLSRQPRSLAARLHLFQASAARGELETVVAHYDRLIELRSLDSNTLADALVGVFREANDWSVLIQYLKKDPESGLALVSRMLRESALPEGLEEVMEIHPLKQAEYFRRIFTENGYEDAFHRWKSMFDIPEQDLESFIFNETLQKRSEPPPFNWSLHSERVEFLESGGLFVSHSGNGAPLIMRQFFSMPSGEYVWQSAARGRMPKNGGALEWRIVCPQAKTRVATLLIDLEKVSEVETFKTWVTIPKTSCDYQRIELRGVAGAFPKSSKTEVLSIHLQELDAERSD